MSHPYYSSGKSYEKLDVSDCYNNSPSSYSYYYVMDIVVVDDDVVVVVDDVVSAAEMVVDVSSFVATDAAAVD